MEDTRVQTQKVIEVTEQPDGEDQCVFIVRCRPEKLIRSFDNLTTAYDQFYNLEPSADFSSCMTTARAALVAAQMDAIAIEEDRASKRLHLVFKGPLDPQPYKQMDETYQRVSAAIHGESRSREKMGKRRAWQLLRDVRRSIYALERLELSDTEKSDLRNQAIKFERLAAIEELAAKADGLDSKDRHELKELISIIRKGSHLDEERQVHLVSLLNKLGKKAWEVFRPVLSEILTAAIKSRFDIH